MPVTNGNPADLTRIETLPVAFHACGYGRDRDGRDTFCIVLQPVGLDPAALGPDELCQVLLNEAELANLIAAARSVQEAAKARRTGGGN
jgi:hypothetical protein